MAATVGVQRNPGSARLPRRSPASCISRNFRTAPIHTGFSHADAVTGLMGDYGVMLALYRRSQDKDFAGELIDLALYEPLFRLEWQIAARARPGHDGARHPK